MVFIFFFFYFFENLYSIKAIQQAFKNVCLDKMLSDGYFDMSKYIFGRIRKEDMYARLTARKSKYAVLYKGAYPKQDNAYSLWIQKIGTDDSADEYASEELSYEDSVAIVNWVYRTIDNNQKRESFTQELFGFIKDLHGIQNDIKFAKGIAYNSAKVEIEFLSSLSQVNNFISSLRTSANPTLFYRGHSDPNYFLQPSIFRTQGLRKNENKLYNDLLIECPADFESCPTHFEKLVKMQHYGLPTRLLDITRNPLVALYFACERHHEGYGELILISAEHYEVKYPQSDTVSILSCLPAFSYSKKEEFYRLATDFSLSKSQFNKGIMRLIHEIQLEKPAFSPEICRDDLLRNFIVYAQKNNSRIIKQDGAFILCGLSDEASLLNGFRYKEHEKAKIVLIEKKKEILNQLEAFSINHATLFPEIECVAEYLKSKYLR